MFSGNLKTKINAKNHILKHNIQAEKEIIKLRKTRKIEKLN